jgi:DNA-binding MarR family transcriptional regulator
MTGAYPASRLRPTRSRFGEGIPCAASTTPHGVSSPAAPRTARRRTAPARMTARAMNDQRRERDIDDAAYEALAREASIGMVPGVNPAAMELSFNLIRAANRLQRDLEISVHRPAGMTLAAFRLLVTIRIVGKITPNEIARQASISPPTATSVLKTLQRYGLVKRSPAVDDGRSIIIELTEEGEEVIAELFRRNNEREVAWLGALTERERRTLVRLLRKVLRHHPGERGPGLASAPPVRHVPPRKRKDRLSG